jgi:hypothetical protein
MKKITLIIGLVLTNLLSFAQDFSNDELLQKLENMSNEELIAYIKAGNNVNEVVSRYGDQEYTAFSSVFHAYGFYCNDEKKEALYTALQMAKEPIKNTLFFLNDPCFNRRNDIGEYYSLLVKHNHGVSEKEFDSIINTYFISSFGEPNPTDSASIARVNFQNEKGKTILMYAAEFGYTKSIKKLLANKADITLKDKSGKTALDYAKLNGNAEIITLMTPASTPPTLPVEGKDKTKKKKSKKSK